MQAIASRSSARKAWAIAPWLLLASALLTTLTLTVIQAPHYGVTIDEPFQHVYGEAVLAWYRSMGRDTSYLTALAPSLHMPQHGGIVDALIVSIQTRFPGADPVSTRHILSGVIGWLGIAAMALCGYELGGPWMASVAALGLWLFPRYSGAMANNSKDIPAAASLAFVMWATLLLLRYWPTRRQRLEAALLLGGALGVATAIRVTAISWFAVLLLLLVGWWLTHWATARRDGQMRAEVGKQALVALVTCATWLLATMALWPYVFLNPAHLIESAQLLSRYPWQGSVLFDGVVYPATHLPGSYAPTWLVIGSPPALLALAALGLALASVQAARERRIDAKAAIPLLGFLVSFVPLLALHPVLYDGLRQFLPVIPPLVALAAYGLVRGVSALWQTPRRLTRGLAVALLLLSVASAAQVAVEIATLFPYEYSYFSPVIGGLPGAASRYDTEYYGTCGKAAAAWLGQNYPSLTSDRTPTLDVSDAIQNSIAPSVPPAFRIAHNAPDFFIGVTRFHENQGYPTYRVVHVIGAEGVAFCVIKANPAILLAAPARTLTPAAAATRRA